MKLNKLILIFFVSLLAKQQFAFTVSGKITDENNQPVPYVSIQVKGTAVNATSNIYGSFNLNLESGNYELIFKIIGFKFKEEKISVSNSNQVLNTKLIHEPVLLDGTTVYARSGFNANKRIAISKLYSDLVYFRYFNLYKENGEYKLLISLLNYADKSPSYASFVNGLAEVFKLDPAIKFSTIETALNKKINLQGKYKYVEHFGAGKTGARFTLKTQTKDTTLTGEYLVETIKSGDSIFFQCPGIYNDKEIRAKAIKSIHTFIDAYYTPFDSGEDLKIEGFSKNQNKTIAKVHNNNQKIASLIIFKNQLSNFYPYKYDPVLFDKRFKESLALTDSAITFNDYYNVLSYLQNAIPDDHVQIYTNIDIGRLLVSYNLPFFILPAKIFIKNNQVYIEDVFDSLNRKHIGSRITNVNGMEVAAFLNFRSQRISYSTQTSKQTKLECDLFKTVLDRPSYKLILQKKDGSTDTLTMQSIYDKLLFENKNDKWMWYVDSLKTKLYIDLNSSTFSSAKALEEIQKNKQIERIIFDELIYPNFNALDLISHFTEKPLNSPVFITYKTSNIFGRILRTQKEDSWVQKAKTPKLNIPCVFLVRGTWSWGETFTDMIKSNKIGKIIGEETGGTNGDVAFIRTPVFDFKFSQIRTIHNSTHLPANESVIEPDIRFEKTEKNFVTYKMDLIKFAATVPLEK